MIPFFFPTMGVGRLNKKEAHPVNLADFFEWGGVKEVRREGGRIFACLLELGLLEAGRSWRWSIKGQRKILISFQRSGHS